MVIVSIYDTKAETWSRPVISDSKAAAMRDFGTLVTNKDTLPGQHPEDFQLFLLMEFCGNSDGYYLEDDYGWLASPQHLANGVDYVKAQDKV